MKESEGLSAASNGKGSRSRRTDESRLGSSLTAEPSWASVASTSQDGGGTMHSPQGDGFLKETAVQTDDELLKYIIPSLRRRALSTTADTISPVGSNKSPSSSEDSNPSFACKNGNGSTGQQSRLGSSSSRGSHHNNDVSTFDTSAVHHVSVNEYESNMGETESLLENEHKAAGVDPTSRLAVGEQSPLFGGENSPLLTHSTDEKFTSCYSTSEETLSDRNVEPFDDLDDLLTGVEPHQGSFGSLSVNLELTPTRVLPPSDASSPQLVDVESEIGGSYGQEDVSTSPGSTGKIYARLSAYSSRETCVSETSDDGDLLRSRLRPTSSAPVLAADQVEGGNGQTMVGDVGANVSLRPGVGGGLLPQATTGGHIPHIQVQYATPCPSDSGPSSERSSESGGTPGSESRRDGESRRPSAGGSSGRASTIPSLEELPLNGSTSGSCMTTVSAAGPHPPAAVPSTAAAPVAAPTSEPPPPPQRGDNDSVQKFQEYLRNRGLDLDLSIVQSSDV